MDSKQAPAHCSLRIWPTKPTVVYVVTALFVRPARERAHRQVEEALQLASGEELQVCAVTGVPDERKGEQLAVLHTLDEQMIPQLIAKAAAGGLPNLFMPSRSHFIKVDTLPMLGTGKLDLRALKRIAVERLQAREA